MNIFLKKKKEQAKALKVLLFTSRLLLSKGKYRQHGVFEIPGAGSPPVLPMLSHHPLPHRVCALVTRCPTPRRCPTLILKPRLRGPRSEPPRGMRPARPSAAWNTLLKRAGPLLTLTGVCLPVALELQCGGARLAWSEEWATLEWANHGSEPHVGFGDY